MFIKKNMRKQIKYTRVWVSIILVIKFNIAQYVIVDNMLTDLLKISSNFNIIF